ncbi:hypothetical protein Patl1_20500 [Pistacia atlantica]|uniref:Uncharacterized protein n=1 Tax=Pistacia atlantica TaxID=434234 RepID=A0ACC1BJY2_9ROSI|nr:hypothetical protein Patl1_20500 [Pistacia atlantica]
MVKVLLQSTIAFASSSRWWYISHPSKRCRFISTIKMSTEAYKFGPYKIDAKEVFYSTNLSFAMVNLRPVVPVDLTYVHVLIVPKREVKRLVDLTADETSDLWLMAQKVGKQLESYHKASSLTFTIQALPSVLKLGQCNCMIFLRMEAHVQCMSSYSISQPSVAVDGPEAGQTVPHVHIHILPRKSGDFERNDEIYDAIDGKEKELQQKLDLDKERKDRGFEEMAQEADKFRSLFV